jgi:hypothetical protein
MAPDVGAASTSDPAVPSHGWWKTYLEAIPEGYLDLIEAEADASRIVHFHPTFVPGLLQTAEYATAVCPATSLKTLTDADVATLVRVRMLRQRSALNGSRQKELVFLLDETSLRRPVGPRETMRDQLEHLLALAEHNGVTLRVVPFHARPHAGHLGPFMLLQYGEGLDDVLCLEWQMGNKLIRGRPDLTAGYHAVSADLMRTDAEGAATMRLIAAALAEFR